jgi:hypothetical protein
VLGAIVLTCQMSQAPAYAEESANPTTEKWRPKDGVYAAPKDFNNQCLEFGDVVIQLAAKLIKGNEWNCKITKLTDTAPDAIRLDMTCDDYNLAEFIDNHDPNPGERKFKETMVLKKIDERYISVRKTQNGKFKYPAWQASYCPKKVQRQYVEERARDKAEAKRKAAEKRSGPKPWRPQEGVYAKPGTDFDDRCLKSGDAIIGLTEHLISSGADKCSIYNIYNITDPFADVVKLGVICNQKPDSKDFTMRNENGELRFAVPGSETVVLQRRNDKTVVLQKTQNGKYIDAGEELAFCGAEAQKKYAQQKAKK